MSEFSTSGSKSGNRLLKGITMDILVGVATELTAATYATLRCICRAWRAVFSSVPYSHHPDQLPFLLLPRPYDHLLPRPHSLITPIKFYHFRFLLPDYPVGPIVRFPRRLDHRYTDSPIFPVGSLGDRKFYPLRSLSGTAGDNCVGSSHGWLVLLRPDSRIYLRNPVTAATIHLPPLLPSVRRYINLCSLASRGSVDLVALVRSAVLSADPSDNRSSFILVVVLECDTFTCFFTCGPENSYAAWRRHDCSNLPAYCFNDIAFHNGLCLAISARSGLNVDHGTNEHTTINAPHVIAVFNFSANPAFQRLLYIEGVDGGNERLMHFNTFLVESAAELLLVERLGRTTEARILIYNLPSIEGNDQIVATPRPGLGDRALFLGKGNSVSVPAPDFPQYIRGNNIYFTDIYLKEVNDQVVYVGCVYVFDVEQGITTKAFEVVEHDEDTMWEILLPWWVTPNLQRKGRRIPRGGRRNWRCNSTLVTVFDFPVSKSSYKGYCTNKSDSD